VVVVDALVVVVVDLAVVVVDALAVVVVDLAVVEVDALAVVVEVEQVRLLQLPVVAVHTFAQKSQQYEPEQSSSVQHAAPIAPDIQVPVEQDELQSSPEQSESLVQL